MFFINQKLTCVHIQIEITTVVLRFCVQRSGIPNGWISAKMADCQIRNLYFIHTYGIGKAAPIFFVLRSLGRFRTKIYGTLNFSNECFVLTIFEVYLF